jgi:hypothetical protein
VPVAPPAITHEPLGALERYLDVSGLLVDAGLAGYISPPGPVTAPSMAASVTFSASASTSLPDSASASTSLSGSVVSATPSAVACSTVVSAPLLVSVLSPPSPSPPSSVLDPRSEVFVRKEPPSSPNFLLPPPSCHINRPAPRWGERVDCVCSEVPGPNGLWFSQELKDSRLVEIRRKVVGERRQLSRVRDEALYKLVCRLWPPGYPRSMGILREVERQPSISDYGFYESTGSAVYREFYLVCVLETIYRLKIVTAMGHYFECTLCSFEVDCGATAYFSLDQELRLIGRCGRRSGAPVVFDPKVISGREVIPSDAWYLFHRRAMFTPDSSVNRIAVEIHDRVPSLSGPTGVVTCN